MTAAVAVAGQPPLESRGPRGRGGREVWGGVGEGRRLRVGAVGGPYGGLGEMEEVEAQILDEFPFLV